MFVSWLKYKKLADNRNHIFIIKEEEIHRAKVKLIEKESECEYYKNELRKKEQELDIYKELFKNVVDIDIKVEKMSISRKFSE